MDLFCQVWMIIFGLVSLWLISNKRSSIARWGHLIGLVGQPAWITTSIVNKQIGIFVLSFVYSALYLRGIRIHWKVKD